MKKVALLIGLVLISLLAGCEYESNILNNLKYVDLIEAREDTLIVFETEDGNERTFYVDNGEGTDMVLLMKKGEIYNVEYTVESWLIYGDFIVKATPVNSKK